MVNALPKLYYEKLNLFRSKIYDPEISFQEKKKEFDEFSIKYLLLPELWMERWKIEFTSRQKNYNKIINQALLEFYSESVYDSINRYYIGVYEFSKIPFDRVMTERSFELFKKRCAVLEGRKECEVFIKDFLSFPHSKLKETLEFYNEYSGKFDKKEILKIYEYSQKQYDRILTNQNDIEKWFKLIIETEDMRFIIQNVEARIAAEYSNKNLWRLYISFLLNINKPAASEVYYRYIRLFLEDTKFKNIFKFVTKKPIFSGTRFLQNYKYGTSFLKRYENQYIIPPQSPQHFITNYLPHQSFKFPVKMIEGMIKNANSTILRKLHFCSKYFFIKLRQPFCHTFILGKNAYFYNDSLKLDKSCCLNIAEKMGQIVVEHAIFVDYISTPFQQPSMLSSIIFHLQCENIRILKLRCQNISVMEYNYLTESGNIEKIVFWDVYIKDEDETYIKVLDIFKNLPKAAYIDLHCFFTICASEDEWNFDRKTAIKYLYLKRSVTYSQKPFFNFLIKHCENNAIVYYPFGNDFYLQQSKNYFNGLVEIETAKNPLLKIPKINLFSHKNYILLPHLFY